MSKSKYKVTGFARFMLFMLFFLPIVYFGLSIAKGDNPESFIEKVKSKITNFKLSRSSSGESENDDLYKKMQLKDEEIQKLREDLFQCQNKK
jgi:hypothetical protein